MTSGPVDHKERASAAAEKPLSPRQQRLWILERLHPRNPAHNVSLGFRITGSLVADEFQRAWDCAVQPYEILGITFQEVEGAPQPGQSFSRPQLRIRNLQDAPLEKRAARLSQLVREEAREPFSLSTGPLLRAFLWQLATSEYAFLLVAHRIVCDEASLRILVKQLGSQYLAVQNGEHPVAPASLSYREYVSHQDKFSPDDLLYWQQKFAGAPSYLDLPIDRARPREQTFHGAAQVFSIEKPIVEKLRNLVDSHDTSPFTTLLAAFAVFLSRHSRQTDFLLGTRCSERSDPNFTDTVGPMENTNVLRVDLSDAPSFSELLARIRGVGNEALLHPKVPIEVLLEKLPLERDLSRNPLFQVAFNEGVISESITAAGLVLHPLPIEADTEILDFNVSVTERNGNVQAKFSYNTDLFEHSTIARMIARFQTLLQSATDNPEQTVFQLPLLPAAEQHQILEEWNNTQVDYPRDVPLHTLIEEQVSRTPESIALIYEAERLTYTELNSRANQLARYLQKAGVGPDILVAVCMERSVHLVIALLAILKAGGAYVPMDPEYPQGRLETMLRDADPPIVLAQSHLLDRLPKASPAIFCLDRDWPKVAMESIDNLPPVAGGKNLAYAIYTSGSTGTPKGVPNVHQGIVNRLLWMQDMYRLTGRDRVLQKTPFSFDVSVWEFFWPLMAGATLVVSRPGGHRDPAYLVNLIAEQGITTLHFVPSMLSIFLETSGLERCGTIRQTFASGEALPFELQQRFFEKMPGNLHNLYGPTEASVDVTYWACRNDSEQPIVPIGRPIANTKIYILDKELQPVPVGVAGELHIGGIGLAREYLNRPDLTAQKFIPDPFSRTPGDRLYKSGDLARFLEDGNIEYLGRIDDQVKLRGFRIELGEIEAVLAECAGVRQSVVHLREDNPGDKRLVAYLIPSAARDLDVEGLRSEIKSKLPDYMVPSRFIVLEKLPMTASGKVDRGALPVPAPEQADCANAVAPRTQIESELVAIFQKVLSITSVGITDNFFDLGGHSLLAARLISEVRKATGQEIPLSALFRRATVESLAQLIREREDMSDPVAMEIEPGDGSRLPFFAIVPPAEESLGYAMLARHMGAEHAVYKIQGHSPVVEDTRPYSQQEMQQLTEEYVAAMRTVQPHGPYCLGGLCNGTHIAEQIVLNLEAQGEEVALFAIFDTWVLQHSQIRWLWKVDYYRQRLQKIKSLSFKERIASYKRAAENKVDLLRGKKAPRTDWQEAYWPNQFTAVRFRSPVVLFKRPKQPFYYIDDPQMGWGARTETGVEIYEVDFHHEQILREPHIRQFGKKLAERISRITRNPSRAHS